jgi:hypothetical protein
MERFLSDVATHEMTVVADEGNVRHLLFKAPDTVTQYFNLTTWPDHLCISGDMGTYVFSRLEDMFDFFRENKINPGYWHEKVKADCTFFGSRKGKNYTFSFIWCLYAIVWGIRKYDEFKASADKTASDKTEKQDNKLLEALKAVEYSARYDSIPCCPVCREFEPQHKDDCIVGNAIATAEGENEK